MSTIVSQVEGWFKKLIASITQVNDSFYFATTVPAGTKITSDNKLQRSGTITSVWICVYWTTTLLQISVTLDDANVFRSLQGSETFIALHNASETFPLNVPFEIGQKLSITANNLDPNNDHRVRIVVTITYKSQ